MGGLTEWDVLLRSLSEDAWTLTTERKQMFHEGSARMIADPREDSGQEFVIGTHWKRLQEQLSCIAFPPNLPFPFVEPPTLSPEPMLRARFQLVRFRRAVSEAEVCRVLTSDQRIAADLRALVALAADTHELEISCVIIALGSRILIEGHPHAPALIVNDWRERGIFLYPVGRPSLQELPNGNWKGLAGACPNGFRVKGRRLKEALPITYFPPELLFLVQCPQVNDSRKRE
jgi:hypothetical protein